LFIIEKLFFVSIQYPAIEKATATEIRSINKTTALTTTRYYLPLSPFRQQVQRILVSSGSVRGRRKTTAGIPGSAQFVSGSLASFTNVRVVLIFKITTII